MLICIRLQKLVIKGEWKGRSSPTCAYLSSLFASSSPKGEATFSCLSLEKSEEAWDDYVRHGAEEVSEFKPISRMASLAIV